MTVQACVVVSIAAGKAGMHDMACGAGVAVTQIVGRREFYLCPGYVRYQKEKAQNREA